MANDYSEGSYKVSVREQAWQKAGTGNPMLVLLVDVLARLEGGGREVPVETRSRHIRLVVSSSEQAEWVRKKVNNAGVQFERWSEINLTGREVVAVCTMDQYDGRPAEQWDLALPGAGPLVEDPSVAEAVDKMFPLTGAVASAGKKAAPAAPVSAEDDIPF